MQYKEFIRRVQEYTDLGSKDDAVRVIKATLETLGERLPRVHRQHLAAQLPNELKSPLLKRHRIERFLLEEFYTRVGARADMRYHSALKSASAVMRVVREAVAPGELDDILSEIPEDFDELLGRKPPSTVSLPSVDAHQLFSEKKGNRAI